MTFVTSKQGNRCVVGYICPCGNNASSTGSEGPQCSACTNKYGYGHYIGARIDQDLIQLNKKDW